VAGAAVGRKVFPFDRGPMNESILPDSAKLVAGSVRGPQWRTLLKEAVRDPEELCGLLNLGPGWIPAARQAAELFPLRVPRGFVARMRPGDPADPLLRQVLPLEEELQTTPGFTSDPLHEAAAQTGPGLLHKYAGRALMVTTGACAVHCRYCFRREFPYQEVPQGLTAWEPALEQLAADATLEEVLLSGGDPLSLTDDRLARLAERLAAIPHLRRLRVHTRWPIVLPERVDEQLLTWMTGTRLQTVVVVHTNHPQELDEPTSAALRRLVRAGLLVFNQAVLLRGVNDDPRPLAELCLRLIELGVIPYYLHQLDRVRGAAHFEVPESRGQEILAELRAQLPGYAVPRYVREVPGAPSKLPM